MEMLGLILKRQTYYRGDGMRIGRIGNKILKAYSGLRSRLKGQNDLLAPEESVGEPIPNFDAVQYRISLELF